MNTRTIKVKDDNRDFVIYHPYPCEHLPPVVQDIPDEGCQCISIDPAINNFAIRIEKRHHSGLIETIKMLKIDFEQYGDVSESTGTSIVNPKILAAVIHALSELQDIIKYTKIIAIERQMAVNYKSTRIFQHILTYFLVMVTTFEYPCIIIDISPKLKGKILGASKKLNHHEIKKWSIEKCMNILSWRNDQAAIEIIKQHRGKSETKADDLADTVIQIEAWFILVGGIYTKPPIVK